MPLKVHILTRISHPNIDALRSLLPSTVEITEGEDVPAHSDFHILVAGFPTQAQIEASPNLRAVIAPFAGAPKEAIELLRDYPQITLHSIHYNVAPTAEMAIGLMLAAAKFMIPMDRDLRHHDWRARYDQTPALILHGRTATVLGYGRIGQRIGSVCHALGMNVIGVRRHAATPDPERTLDDFVELHPPADLRDLLPRSDVLFVAVPLTQETEGMIGAKELALLPHDAVVVNVGRARVIDEGALYEVLRSRSILAAGLDVWYHYPLRDEDRSHTAPSRFPFHELDNVVMSPHRGGWITAAEETRIVELAGLLRAAAEGRPVPSQVDKDLGY